MSASVLNQPRETEASCSLLFLLLSLPLPFPFLLPSPPFPFPLPLLVLLLSPFQLCNQVSHDLWPHNRPSAKETTS